MTEAERLRAALEEIGTACRNYTGKMSCITAGRTRAGSVRSTPYGADAWCEGCIARVALEADEDSQQPEGATKVTTVYVDTETTGLYRHAGHEVWEVGLIRVDGTYETVDEYAGQLPVDAGKADPMALTVSGWYERRGRDSGLVHSALSGDDNGLIVHQCQMQEWAALFARLTVGAIWVGAVPSFDTGFLDPLLREHGACPGWHYQLVDVETLVIGYLRASVAGAAKLHRCFRPNGSWDSNRLSRAVCVDPDQFDRHTALGDCRWARALHEAVMGGG